MKPSNEPFLGPLPPSGEKLSPEMLDLAIRFRSVGSKGELGWNSKYEGMKLVGKGGQGIVFRSERSGADGFRLPVALKAYSPEVYSSTEDYESDMRRIGSVAMRVAQLQNHHLLDVHNFIERDQIRVMVMEWVNGYDLHHLLSPQMLEAVKGRVSDFEWNHLTDVVITHGPKQSRLKPGVAIQILRECLTGLASLHREGVAHGDIKPANVMIKRTGNVKLVDFGSAVDMKVPGSRIAWTPAYAAPEILDGAQNSPQSDLASLGYVLAEMLSGRVLFQRTDSIESLRAMKRSLPKRLKEILPPDIVRNKDLMELCHNLVNPDPNERMASAEEANIIWAANLHRQLVKTDLDSEYENDLRVWMESLPLESPLSTDLLPPGSSLPDDNELLTNGATILM